MSALPAAAPLLANSKARRLLVPVEFAPWHIVGIESGREAHLRQLIHAVRQALAGSEEIRPLRPMGAGAVVGIIIGVLFLLILVGIPLIYLIDYLASNF